MRHARTELIGHMN